MRSLRASPAQIDIVIPPRVACARCDGGGCDGCERRGGHRVPGEPEARVVRVTLPLALEGGALLRIVRPLEGAGDLEQLILEARLAETTSPCVSLRALASPAPKDPRPTHATHGPRARDSTLGTLGTLAFLVMALAAALAFALAR